MMIRPITKKDLNALWNIAQHTGIGFSSLQPNRDMIESKLEWALRSFDAEEPLEEAFYLFVIEEPETKQVVGVAGIKSAVGLSDSWYNFHINSHTHMSTELGVRKIFQTLSLCSDHTGSSELCTLFLLPEFREGFNGRMLSKSRFLFIANHLNAFNDRIIAEMRGHFTADNQSPFWDGVSQHFFDVDFATADQLSIKDKTFIAELIPRYPLLTCFLPNEAIKAMGKTHVSTDPARYLLEKEGFRYTNYIDIFDGGPLLESPIRDLLPFKQRQQTMAKIKEGGGEQYGDYWLVSNDRFKDFSCILTKVNLDEEGVSLSPQQAEQLSVENGENLSLIPLHS